jgi:hypothetical protein
MQRPQRPCARCPNVSADRAPPTTTTTHRPAAARTHAPSGTPTPRHAPMMGEQMVRARNSCPPIRSQQELPAPTPTAPAPHNSRSASLTTQPQVQGEQRPSVALACKGPLNARRSFFLSFFFLSFFLSSFFPRRAAAKRVRHTGVGGHAPAGPTSRSTPPAAQQSLNPQLRTAQPPAAPNLGCNLRQGP